MSFQEFKQFGIQSNVAVRFQSYLEIVGFESVKLLVIFLSVASAR